MSSEGVDSIMMARRLAVLAALAVYVLSLCASVGAAVPLSTGLVRATLGAVAAFVVVRLFVGVVTRSKPPGESSQVTEDRAAAPSDDDMGTPEAT